MNIIVKNRDYSWDLFIDEWGPQFNDAKQILNLLNTYPHWIKILRLKKLNTAKDIESTQKEWLWLLSKQEHPDDIVFLKPWWVMIETNDYDSFLDLSDPQYPIFKTVFYSFLKPAWGKIVLFPKISELLLNIEDETIITEMMDHAWGINNQHLLDSEEVDI